MSGVRLLALTWLYSGEIIFPALFKSVMFKKSEIPGQYSIS